MSSLSVLSAKCTSSGNAAGHIMRAALTPASDTCVARMLVARRSKQATQSPVTSSLVLQQVVHLACPACAGLQRS